MDEFLNNNQETEENSPEINVDTSELNETDTQPELETQSTSEAEQTPQPENTASTEQYTSVYNPVRYSTVEPVADYKPMSKGLKLFAVIMAFVILMTGGCLAGYFIGRNSVSKGPSKTNVNLASTPKDTDEMTAAQVYEQVNKSIVGIMIYNDSGKSSQASGIIFSKDGYIVTNDHIYSEVPAAKFKVYTADGGEYSAKYVAGDIVSDLAVLKVDNAELSPAVFGNSDEIFYGQNVVAIGRPIGAAEESSITNGIVSAIDCRVRSSTTNYSARLIQTNSAINPGNSGGALVNMFGQVIGVTSSKLVSAAYDNVGYAIPTTVMKRIVDELIAEGKVVSRAKLGITYTVIDSVTAEISGHNYVGIYIASVAEDSGLYGKAQEGDIITHINGTEVVRDTIVLDIIEQSRAGDTITVTIVSQSGSTRTVEAELKANIGESSYSTEQSPEGGSQGSGTFDFPDGE